MEYAELTKRLIYGALAGITLAENIILNLEQMGGSINRGSTVVQTQQAIGHPHFFLERENTTHGTLGHIPCALGLLRSVSS